MTFFDFGTSIIIFNSLVFFVMGLITWLRPGTHVRAARALALYFAVSLLSIGVRLAMALGWLVRVFDQGFTTRLPLYGLAVLAIAWWLFNRAYIGLEPRVSGEWVAGAFWLGLIVMLEIFPNILPVGITLEADWNYPRSDLLVSTSALCWGFFYAVAVRDVSRAYRKTHQPLYRNRLKYIAPMMLFLVAGDALDWAGAWYLGGAVRLPGVLIALYAALTHYLPTLRRAFWRALSYLATTSLAFGFSLAMLLGLWVIYQRVPVVQPWLIAALAALFAVVLYPTMHWLLAQINRWVAGVRSDPRHILHSYSQSISNVLDLSQLTQVILELAGQALEVRRGYLFLVNHEKNESGQNCFRLHGVSGSEENSQLAYDMLEESPLAVYLRISENPLTQYDIDLLPRFEAVTQEDREWLSSLAVEIFIPIRSKGEWIGLLALGPKVSGAPYLAEDQLLLRTLADQTAIALENVRLVESLLRLNQEFRRAILALNQANRNLERLDRTKSEFISVASHELRTPLTVMSGYSQILLDDLEIRQNPEQLKLLTGIHQGTGRLHEIVDSLLDMAKIDARELNLEPQPIAIDALVDSVIESMTVAFQERSQVFMTRGLENLPAVEADQDALRKVFLHLLGNAVKYTPDGGKISLVGRQLLPSASEWPDGGVELVVSDTGVGIDKRYIEVIFTKFFQTGELALHSSGKTKFKGSGPGLGLAIAKGIVEAHGGRIWAESPGYDEVKCPGSRFYIQLPLRQKREKPEMQVEFVSP